MKKLSDNAINSIKTFLSTRPIINQEFYEYICLLVEHDLNLSTERYYINKSDELAYSNPKTGEIWFDMDNLLTTGVNAQSSYNNYNNQTSTMSYVYAYIITTILHEYYHLYQGKIAYQENNELTHLYRDIYDVFCEVEEDSEIGNYYNLYADSFSFEREASMFSFSNIVKIMNDPVLNQRYTRAYLEMLLQYKKKLNGMIITPIDNTLKILEIENNYNLSNLNQYDSLMVGSSISKDTYKKIMKLNHRRIVNTISYDQVDSKLKQL